MTNEEIYTVNVTFSQVPYETEFLRNNVQVWCRTSPDGATKINAPGAGNVTKIDLDEIVTLDELDVPGKLLDK